jgi:hypothetical protein
MRYIHLIYQIMEKLSGSIDNKCFCFSKYIFIQAFVMFFANGIANAQNELDVIRNNWLEYTDAPNSFYHFLTGEAFKLLTSREVKISQIKTIDDLLKRQEEVRKTLWQIAGPFPGRTPLNARITGTIRKKGYRVENIIYESLPGFFVTASLFIPSDISKPAPAILFCSGHSSGAYRLPFYQLPLLNLVQKGFVVLAIDPVGQGERLQYFDPAKGESAIGGSTNEHSYPSAQVFLTGRSIARYFIWDGIRGIDYLVSRKEVDPGRIGVHGLSGGGTQTAFISALDNRVAASAPAGYITSYRRLMESVGVQDGEQNLYHGISCGIDHADFIEIRAPKPTLIMATTGDFFSIQGTRETYAEVKRIYELSGSPDNIEITEDDYGHGYTRKNREAMYAFFQKYLQLPGSPAEEDVEYSTPEELQKTSSGQLSNSLGGETVFSLNRNESEGQEQQLQSSRADLKRHLSAVLNSSAELSGYRKPSVIDEPVFTGRILREDYSIEKYFVKGEGDYIIPYLLMIPSRSNSKALIYLHPAGKLAEAAAGGEMEWFAKNGFTVLAPDLIGTGETGPGVFTGDVSIDSVSYNLWYTSVLIGRSLTGIRAGDVVRLAELLKKNDRIREVCGIASGIIGPVLLHAAAYDKDIKRVAIVESCSSYQSIAENRFYDPKLVNCIVPGALKSYDLPDLAAALAPGRLLMAGVTDGSGKSDDAEGISSDLEIIRSSYHSMKADDQLKIVINLVPEKLHELYLEWLR